MLLNVSYLNLIMGLTYDNTFLARQKASIKSEGEKAIMASGDFPDCKGLFPDCPENPSLEESMCRTCPKTDDLKKPKLDDD
jgi:hypothetical protein